MAKYEKCIEACLHCASDCEVCLHKMIGKPSDNDCPQCCRECVDICWLCAQACRTRAEECRSMVA